MKFLSIQSLRAHKLGPDAIIRQAPLRFIDGSLILHTGQLQVSRINQSILTKGSYIIHHTALTDASYFIQDSFKFRGLTSLKPNLSSLVSRFWNDPNGPKLGQEHESSLFRLKQRFVWFRHDLE
jgi:hypothetical protein